jgi:hypothetical protein
VINQMTHVNNASKQLVSFLCIFQPGNICNVHEAPEDLRGSIRKTQRVLRDKVGFWWKLFLPSRSTGGDGDQNCAARRLAQGNHRRFGLPIWWGQELTNIRKRMTFSSCCKSSPAKLCEFRAVELSAKYMHQWHSAARASWRRGPYVCSLKALTVAMI